MTKMKHEDYLRETLTILDRLEKVEDLNRSSSALVRLSRTVLNDNDTRYAYEKAVLADFMHGFCLMQDRINKSK